MNAIEGSVVDEVVLTLPASPEFLHVVRSVVSAVGARQGLSYDVIGDLSLAASEAAGYLLALAGPATQLSVGLHLQGGVGIRLMTDAGVRAWPPEVRDSLAWIILSALVHEVELFAENGCPGIRLFMKDAS